VKGDRPGLTPRHSASLWSTYVIAPQWRIGGGLNYRGEQNPDGQRIYTAKAFTTVDVMAERTMNDSTLVKFNISNLTNLLYVDQLYRGFYIPGVGRRVEISLKKMF
jgi:catecholate siderophore receptor